jgi:undecaprenyl pyrophosphate phosphatase UppP
VSGEFEITSAVVAGFFASLISGYFAIEVFLRYVRTHSLRVFAYYLFVFAPIAAIIITLN